MELQCAVKCFKDGGWTVEGQDSVRRLLAAGETTQAPPCNAKVYKGRRWVLVPDQASFRGRPLSVYASHIQVVVLTSPTHKILAIMHLMP